MEKGRRRRKRRRRRYVLDDVEHQSCAAIESVANGSLKSGICSKSGIHRSKNCQLEDISNFKEKGSGLPPWPLPLFTSHPAPSPPLPLFPLLLFIHLLRQTFLVPSFSSSSSPSSLPYVFISLPYDIWQPQLPM